MPKWIHDRAQHIMGKNPDMDEGTAWAIATQQSHSLGKTPKSYGTSEGKEIAKEKYKTPKDDIKTANPGHSKSASTIMLFACAEELADITKTANLISTVGGGLKNALQKGWAGQGRLGQGMTLATTGLQAPEALVEEDPTGQQRSRAERLAGIGGFVGGGIAGQSLGEDMGAGIARVLDPKDAYKARYMKGLDRTVSHPMAQVSTNPIKQKASEVLQRATMTAKDRAAEGIRGEFVKGIKGQMLNNMSTGARWANRGLRALPMVAGMGMSFLGSEAGKNLLAKPFKWTGKQNPNPGVVGQLNTPETEQSTVTLSNNN